MKMDFQTFFSRIFLSLLLTFLMVSTGLAQVSAGGTPLSFSFATTSSVPTQTMADVDVDIYLAEDAEDGKDVAYRFGAPIDVHFDLGTSGYWTTLQDGGRLWRLRIESTGAYSINLLYDDFYMPEGAQFFLYSDDHSRVIGAFTSYNNKEDGTFATAPVAGDAITLEYYEPADVIGQGVISIWRVVHAYRNVFGFAGDPLLGYGDSGTCNNNVNCPEGLPWQAEKRGVAMILTSGGSRLCTGSLVNNVRNDFTPYFLTANHCGSSSTWMFMFNYESPGCTNEDGPTNQTVSNATQRANYADSDFSLFELSVPVPEEYNPYFNGWSAVDVAATQSVAIHHPSGDIKKISFDYDAAVSSRYFSDPPDDSHWKILTWEDGTTEPGSSGSPLFDQNHRITGQLHGGLANCSNNIDDYYGKVSMSWDRGSTAATRLKDWLDPDNTGTLELDGIDPAATGGITGIVRDDSAIPLQGVLVSVVGGTQQTSSNGSGEYTLHLQDSTYSLEYSKYAYESTTITGIVVAGGELTTQDAVLNELPIVTVFSEDFESGAPGWTHEAGVGWGDQWHLSTEQMHAGANAYKCGDTGTGVYANSLDARLISPVIADIPDEARLYFWIQLEGEVSGYYADSAYDGGIFEISADGGPFAQVTPTTGYPETFRWESGGGSPATGPMLGYPCWATKPTWDEIVVDLLPYAGQDIQLRYRFGSDAGGGNEGWYVDDILITAIGGVPVTEVIGLVLIVDGTDLKLSWDADANYGYRVYSDVDPMGSFGTFVGETTANELILDMSGGFDDKKFYVVKGWDGSAR